MNQSGKPQQTDQQRHQKEQPQSGGRNQNTVPALEVLRDRVVHAVEEITRLRSVNSELAARVGRLEKLHGVSAGASSFVIDEEPEILKEKITGYIQAIDAYLEEVDETQQEAE